MLLDFYQQADMHTLSRGKKVLPSICCLQSDTYTCMFSRLIIMKRFNYNSLLTTVKMC